MTKVIETTNTISTIHTNLRQSNIELLRIISVFLILVFHAGFTTNGLPTIDDIDKRPIGTFGRYILESMSVICVDIFIIISGWFGIKQKIINFCRFCFQCVFIFIIIYGFTILSGYNTININGILGLFALTKTNWFIKAYIGLYILSPIINAYLATASKKSIEMFLISYYVFQTIYGWMINAAIFIESGFSVFSFIGLYVLGNYIHKYKNTLTSKSKWHDLLICIIIVIIESIIAFATTGYAQLTYHVYTYVSPLVIINCIFLMLFFSKLNITNNAINYIATSSFAAFLIHANPYTWPIFQNIVKLIYSEFSGLKYVSVIFCYLSTVYFAGIILDQIRKIAWKYVTDKTFIK